MLGELLGLLLGTLLGNLLLVGAPVLGNGNNVKSEDRLKGGLDVGLNVMGLVRVLNACGA